MQPLFIRPDTAIEKTAMSMAMHRLGPKPEGWVEETIQILQENNPFLSEYSLRGKVTMSSPERLYATGYVEVRHIMDRDKSGRAVRVPFVVEAGSLYPPAVFIDGNGVSDLLKKEIFAQAIFDPQITTQVAKEQHPAPSLYDQLFPPQQHRAGFLGPLGVGTGGFGPQGGGKVAADEEALYVKLAERFLAHDPSEGPWLGDDAELVLMQSNVKLSRDERQHVHRKAMQKLAEKNTSSSLLGKIAHTIDKDTQREVIRILEKNASITRAIEVGGNAGLLKMALSVERSVSPNLNLQPDVVQITPLGSGQYLVKGAQVDNFEPESRVVSSRALGKMVGDDVVGEVDADGSLTISTRPAKQTNLEDVKIEKIKDFGTWRVQELDSGDHVLGWCIPNVIDLDMHSMPLVFWTNGKEYAFQESVAGVRNGGGAALPSGVPEPHDLGVFYYTTPGGGVTCTVLLTITAVEEDEHGKAFIHATDQWGRKARLSYAQGLKAIVSLEDGRYHIPSTMQWFSVRTETRLVPEPVMFSKLAMLQEDSAFPLKIIFSGDSYALKGPGAEKLAHDHRNGLSADDTEFLLVGMGMGVSDCRRKIAEATVYGSRDTYVFYPATSKSLKVEKIASVERVLMENWKRIAEESDIDLRELRPWALKTAALMPFWHQKVAALVPNYASPRAVDTVLSLGFINADNLALFAENIPHLEETRRDLCELYTAVILGLPDVSRVDILRAAEALWKVSEGLKKVKMRSMVV